MKREILQIGMDAESLYRYIVDHGDEANPLVIKAQIRLLNTHSSDLEAGSEGKVSGGSMVSKAVSR